MQVKLFPQVKREATYQKYIKDNPAKRIPIIVFFYREKIWKNFKQYMLVSIDPKKTLHEFAKTIQLKLLLEGYLTEKNRIFYLNVRQKQLNVNHTMMESIYKEYQSPDGWLELTITLMNPFG